MFETMAVGMYFTLLCLLVYVFVTAPSVFLYYALGYGDYGMERVPGDIRFDICEFEGTRTLGYYITLLDIAILVAAALMAMMWLIGYVFIEIL